MSRTAAALVPSRPVSEHPFLRNLAPVADALGAVVLPPGRGEPGDIPLTWDGELVGHLRMPQVPAPQLQGALARMIDAVEAELGGRLSDLGREDKQRAVRLLDERGAFVLRRSVEDVADAFGVSRITIYNYLNATRGE